MNLAIIPLEPTPQFGHDSCVSTGSKSSGLLARVARGDLNAVQTCMNRYGNVIWALARRYSSTRADAEDAVQEIFTDLWKSAWRYDAERASEEVFVAMIARRRLVDRHRARSRAIEFERMAANESAMRGDDTSVSLGESNVVQKALGKLRPEQREVLVLAACEDLTHQEIADRTGLALGTVKTHARRGLLELRRLLFESDTVTSPEVDVEANE